MHEVINLYHRFSDFFRNQQVLGNSLYSNLIFDKIAGLAIYNMSLINNRELTEVDVEDGTFFLGLKNEDTIFFKIALYNRSINGIFIPGETYVFGISGGSGKYLNATGTVTFYIGLDDLVQNITVDVNYLYTHNDTIY